MTLEVGILNSGFCFRLLCREDVISTVVSEANRVEKSGLAVMLHADFLSLPLFLSLPAASSCDQSCRGKTEDT